MVGVVVLVVILIVLACIPLAVWLTTKLLLVPSILVLERARFRDAFVRSWRLTRGRFWVAFGVTFLISAIMGIAAQVVSVPATLLGSLLGSVVAPTGAADPSAAVAFVVTLIAPPDPAPGHPGDHARGAEHRSRARLPGLPDALRGPGSDVDRLCGAPRPRMDR
ncbi:hypothetical protein JM654_13455 [Microbacterium oxydans]|nr:hypothetical protein [Microbacterium oxydans]